MFCRRCFKLLSENTSALFETLCLVSRLIRVENYNRGPETRWNILSFQEEGGEKGGRRGEILKRHKCEAQIEVGLKSFDFGQHASKTTF